MVLNHQLFWLMWFGVLGLCLGSFLNVVIWRLPRGISIILPTSACPACGAKIHWYDNIPIISYVVLRGRCRKCEVRISLRYPLIEALTGVVTVLVFWRFGISIQGAIRLLLVLLMIAVATIDAEHMIIPDEISLGGAAVGLGLSFIRGGVEPLEALIGASAGAASLWLVRWVHMKIAKIEGMGLGDVKLAGTIGAFLGWYALPMVLLASTTSGLFVGGIFLAIKGKGARTPLPFGTFLAIGAIVYVFAEQWWTSYLIK
jgi:leader peptidase (prepilin peptidase)/N-methyltransferase